MRASTPKTSTLPAERSVDNRFRNDAFALGFSAILTALVGMVGWVVAARLLPTADVGRATAFVNGFLFVAGISELGMSQAVLRWLPPAGQHRFTIVRRVYVTGTSAALVFGTLYVFVVNVQLPGNIGLGGSRALFLVSAAGWMIFHVQDAVLASIGAARWVPLENGLFGLIRLALLAALAVPFGALGIVLSWTIASAFWVVAVTVLLVRRSHTLSDVPGVMPQRGDALRTTGATYVSLLGLTLMMNLVPVIVVEKYGPALGAVFAMVWVGLNALDYAGVGFGSALVVRVTGHPTDMLRTAARTVLPFFAVMLSVAALIASPLLHIFGPEYAAEGTALLRLAIAGAFFRVVVVLVASVHLATGHVVRMAAIHWVSGAVVIGLVATASVGNGLEHLGLLYLLAQVALALGVIADLVISARRRHPSEPAAA